MTTARPPRPEDALAEQAKGKVCVTCGEEPRVAWVPTGETRISGLPTHAFRLRCRCYPKAPALAQRPSIIQERVGELVAQQGSQALATREGALRLAQEVKQYLAPKATTEEVAVFIKFCQGLGLNPFIKEVYLVKYDERSPAAIVVGVQAYLKWAARNPAWGGFESGIVVMKDGKAEERQGSLVFPGETLMGGWCVVHRTGSVNLKRVVALSEYNKNQSLWKTMPATMIEKTAIGQGVRRQFPEDFLAFQGLAERMAVTVDEQVGEDGAPPLLGGAPQDEQAALGFGTDGDMVVDAPQRPQEGVSVASDDVGDGDAPVRTRRLENEPDKSYFFRVAWNDYKLHATESLGKLGSRKSGAPMGNWEAWIAEGHSLEEALAKLRE